MIMIIHFRLDLHRGYNLITAAIDAVILAVISNSTIKINAQGERRSDALFTIGMVEKERLGTWGCGGAGC